MASRVIAVFLRIFGRRRRFALNLIVAVLLFITWFFTFYARPPDEPPIKSASSKTIYENILRDCPCSTKQQTADDMAKPSAPVTASKSFTSNKQALRGSGSTAGRLNVHIWSEVCGTSVDILRNWPHFPYFPNERSFISEFRKTQELGSFNYGARIFGFIHPKRSGRYKFAITSDDTSELWLSPNEDPASSEMIARVYLPYASAWTEEGDYNRYPEQISKEITLQAGKKYYIESLNKQGYGFAHLSVYWSYSFSNSTFNIISSKYLSSFSATDNQEYIPPHAGMPQSNNSLQEKSSFLYFNRLPLINRKEYRSHIPTCPYSPSFLVRRKLQRYEGITLTSESRVFPQDDTDMIKSNFRPAWTTPNKLINKTLSIEPVVEKFILSLGSRKYFLKNIHKVIHKPDPVNGDRFLLNLELGLKDTNQSFRLSEHVYQQKGNEAVCLPDGIEWNKNAKVYIVLTVKDQGNWVHYFINQLTDASLLSNDTNFHVIVIDFGSKDIDMAKAFNTPLLGSRHTIISLAGKFFKTVALNIATELVPNIDDIIFVFDLHIDVPPDILDSVRMNTIAGKMAFFPVVGRLECDSSSTEHRGYWESEGYGIVAIYKSDWLRVGGMNTLEYRYSWGGEDWELLDRVLMLPLEVERIKYPGLYHHFHFRQRTWN